MTHPPGRPQGPPGPQGSQGWWQPGPYNQQGQPYAQPAFQQQGFGGGFQSQYGGLGAFGEQSPRKSRKGKVLAVVVAVVVVLGGGGAAAWYFGLFQGDVLDPQSVEQGVARVLRDSFGEHDVSNVQCPGGQQIEAGHTFECSVDISGRTKTVSIRVLNEKPEYEVGAPE